MNDYEEEYFEIFASLDIEFQQDLILDNIRLLILDPSDDEVQRNYGFPGEYTILRNNTDMIYKNIEKYELLFKDKFGISLKDLNIRITENILKELFNGNLSIFKVIESKIENYNKILTYIDKNILGNKNFIELYEKEIKEVETFIFGSVVKFENYESIINILDNFKRNKNKLTLLYNKIELENNKRNKILAHIEKLKAALEQIYNYVLPIKDEIKQRKVKI